MAKSDSAASAKSAPAAPKMVSTLTFIGMTCALAVSIRNIPDVADTGWTGIFYMLVATILYGLPVCLIAGEFTTALPGAGGPELWNTASISVRWGFTTSWLLWAQMFPGMVMVASVIAPMLAYVIGQPDLGTNGFFTFICIIVAYWILTFLNMRFDMAKFGGQWGVIVGVYIPVIIMYVLGFWALAKVGIDPKGTLGPFDAAKLVPDTSDWSSLALFSPIIFIFAGIELSAVYVQRLAKPERQYPIGVFVALLLMLLFNLINGLLTANIVPNGQMDLNNICQPVQLYVQVLGLPDIIVPIFAFLVLIGVLTQLSGWISGPSQTVTSTARRGEYPPKWHFWKTNQYGLSRSVLLVQAVIISIFSCVFIMGSAVNNAFLLLVNATSMLYCIVYVIMTIGFFRLRKKYPQLPRPFRVGKSGNGLGYFVGWVLIITIFFANFLTYLTSSAFNNIGVTIVTVVLFVIPLIIDKKKNPQWLVDVNKELVAEGYQPEGDNPLQAIEEALEDEGDVKDAEKLGAAPPTAGTGTAGATATKAAAVATAAPAQTAAPAAAPAPTTTPPAASAPPAATTPPAPAPAASAPAPAATPAPTPAPAAPAPAPASGTSASQVEADASKVADDASKLAQEAADLAKEAKDKLEGEGK